MFEPPVWAEVDLQAIAYNMQQIRQIVSPQAEIMAVVKADAYGHGAVEVARVVLKNGASRLAVARVDEAEKLRKAGIKTPILLLGYTPPGQFEDVVRLSLGQTVYSAEMASILNEIAGRLRQRVAIHIKIDTGMGRLGLLAEDASLKEVLAIARLPHLELEGIFTHFATADSRDKLYALEQFERFLYFLDNLRREGLITAYQHCANSAAIIDLPQTHLNMVRPGIAIYGLYPSTEVQRSRLSLKPAMALKARVAQVKKVPAGFKISYGATYQTTAPTVIATLPAGYADGYTRLLSSKGKVLLHGQRAQVVGRVCMDQCMIDVGHIPSVSCGDEVVFFGKQEGAVLPVEEVAEDIGTINYEVVCMVSSRVPRIYL
ncbi:MAG: alanine racemase [Firmicutes bacterium]|nr:alanine racemase [Bacillota bacterium]